MERIVFIQDHLGQGGVGTVNRELITEFRDRGYKVHNVTLFRADAVQGVKNSCLHVSSMQAILVIPFLYKLNRFFRTNQFDYVISSKDYINIWVIVAFRLARCKKARLLVNSHISVSEKLKFESKRIQRWSIRCARYLYRYADIVANVSEAASRDSERFFDLPKVHTLYNPVISRADLERKFQRPDHPFFGKGGTVIVACGRLEEQKNYDLMIRAFANALMQRSELYLIILGEGSLRKKLEKLIKDLGINDYVSLAGFNPDPKAFMAHCDLFWLTSRFEGFGVVLVEALSVGAAVLSVDCPHGPREILDNGRYGRLVCSFRVAHNSRAFLEVLDSPRLDRKLLRRRALDFETKVCADRYLSVLRDEKTARVKIARG